MNYAVPSLRISHVGDSRGLKPVQTPPVPWNVVVPTHRREHAVEGMVMGCAVAESLTLCRNGIHPRVALKLYGRPPLQFQFQPGVGVTSHRTHGLIMTIQSMLLSRTDRARFSSQLRKRIAWYQRSFPVRHLRAHASRWMAQKFGTKQLNSLDIGFGDDPLIRSLAISVMLQGCTDNATRWFESSVAVTHKDSRVLHVSLLMGYATQIAQITESDIFNSQVILDALILSTEEPELKCMLEKLVKPLSEKKSVSSVATLFGYEDGIPRNVFAIAVMGIYSWLRHPKNFRRAVESVAVVGGSCCNAAAITGGLSGISLGAHQIPSEWRNSLTLFPFGKAWKEQLIERVKDWPHGVEDIQKAESLPSRFLGQILRNTAYSFFHLIHKVIRFPIGVIQFSFRKPPGPDGKKHP